MGVDYFLVSDEAKETYFLGRGAWYDCKKEPCLAELLSTARDIALDYGANTGDARRFASELIQWAQERGGKVYIVNDAEDDFDKIKDYIRTGDVTDRREMSHEDIQKRIKQVADDLCKELGADSVDIFVTIEKTPLIDDPDERHFFKYIGISGYDKQISGYQLVREKTQSQY